MLYLAITETAVLSVLFYSTRGPRLRSFNFLVRTRVYARFRFVPLYRGEKFHFVARYYLLYFVGWAYLALNDLFFGKAKKAQYGVSLGCHLRAVAYLRTTTAKWGQESHVVR